VNWTWTYAQSLNIKREQQEIGTKEKESREVKEEIKDDGSS
jgi:hypothetical protein